MADPQLVDRLAAADPELWPGVLDNSSDQSLGRYGRDTDWPLLRSALRPDGGDSAAPGLRADFRRFSGARLPQRIRCRRRATIPTPPTASLCARRCSFSRNSSSGRSQPRQSFRRSATTTTNAAITSCSPVGRFWPTRFHWSDGSSAMPPDPALNEAGKATVITARSRRRHQGVVSQHQFPVGPLPQCLRFASRRRSGASDARLGRSRTCGGERGRGAGLAALSHPARDRRVRDTAPRLLPGPDDRDVGPGLCRRLLGADATVLRTSSPQALPATHTWMISGCSATPEGHYGFALITPAVSPIFGQNPAFRTFTYDAAGGVIDETTYNLTNLPHGNGRRQRVAAAMARRIHLYPILESAADRCRRVSSICIR